MLEPLPALPPLFVSHGSPMIALEPREAGAFLQRLGAVLRHRFGTPRAVLAVSAHTLAHAPTLLAAARHEALHDFGGFDERLSTMRYDAPGAPALAARVQARLQDAGIAVAMADAGGLDHGIWTALHHVFPAADVPVLPLAWPPQAPPAQLMALGAALAPLAEDGVLILCTGSITHNLRRVFAQGLHDAGRPATPESLAFRDWFAQRASAADWPALQAYRARAPHAALMHPTDEHLLPWFVAAGAGGAAWPAVRVHASQTFGDLGMDAYAFGTHAGALAQALHASGA